MQRLRQLTKEHDQMEDIEFPILTQVQKKKSSKKISKESSVKLPQLGKRASSRLQMKKDPSLKTLFATGMNLGDSDQK